MPFQVSICFHDTENDVDVVWLFSRDLLCAAYADPEAIYGDGDLRCCVIGRDLFMKIVISPRMLVFTLDAEEVAVFLEETLHDISVGKEEESEIEECIDTAISDILNEAGA